MRGVVSTGALALVSAAVVACGGTTSAAGHPSHRPAAAARCSQSSLPLPDLKCTSGALNPSVRQDTIRQTICTPGWTKTIRPPVSYTNQLKRQGIADYGYADTNPADYEEDHFLPLELGGAPRDPKNLWPEPHAGNQNSYSKDRVENDVKVAVCDGKATLADAQHAMLTNWTTAEQVLGIGGPSDSGLGH
jgi:hypothetical protein